MKKIVLALTALAIVLASCSDGADTQFDFAALEALKASNPAVASGTDGTESPAATPAITETEAPIATPDVTTVTTIGGITIGADGTLTISSSKVVFIGDASETIDGVEYKVKKYAQLVIDDNPYFYTYCKLYYLNDKLRRFYSFDHGIGCEMDYKYDEFVEHECGGVKIYTYYEDGKLESHIKFGYDATALINGYQYVKNEYEYYSNAALKLYKAYACTNTKDLNASASWALYSKQEYEYHSNGETKQIKLYSNTNTASPSEGTLYLSRKDTYAESGKTESSISYSPEGWETSKKLYTYYDNGNQKSYENYSNGKPTEKTTYYESGEQKTKENYNNGLLTYKYSYYENGKQKSYEIYSNGLPVQKLTYLENGKTESNITYAADGVTETKTLYTYYESGKIKLQESYNNGKLSRKQTYLENGKQESDITYAADGVTETSKALYTYYDNGKTKTLETYSAGKLSSKSTYYDNGKQESNISYAADGVTETSKWLYTYYDNGMPKTSERYSAGKLDRKYTYYESGKLESDITYAADGVTEASKTLYTYYDNGNKKTEERYSAAGKKSNVYMYFNESIPRQKLGAGFYSDTGKLCNLFCRYMSGYDRCNYDGSYFYTYADGKTTTLSTDPSVYSSKEAYTQEQAEAKLEELLNE